MRTPGLASFIGLVLAATVDLAAAQTTPISADSVMAPSFSGITPTMSSAFGRRSLDGTPASADDSDRPCCGIAASLV